MSVPKDIVDLQKRPVSLLKLLGRGGEGSVYEIAGDSTKAAKIYLPDKALLRREKVLAMIQGQLYNGATNVAYPIGPLFKSNGAFAGFTMEKVTGKKPVHELYSPSSRRQHFSKANFPFLVHAALNIAGAVSTVHAKGCVIGDINHSGILISQGALATLIDADSFQFKANGNLFRCTVGVPDFTPPELQGKRLDQIERTINHDCFGLGVAIFSLLFMGRHPFVGDYLGKGVPAIEKAIAEYRFAYSSDRRRTGMEPPPHVPTMGDLPTELANAFEAAFSPTTSAGGRPMAKEWVRLLQDSEPEIVQCRSSSSHHYFKSANSCPWCRMERGFPGFVAFATTIPGHQSAPIDVSQLIAAIRAVPDPGIAPPLLATMPAVQLAQPTSSQTSHRSSAYFILATGAAIGSIPLFTTQTISPALALISFSGCAYAALRSPKQLTQLDRQLETLKGGLRRHEEMYETLRANQHFLEIKQEAEKKIRELGELANDEAKQISDLSKKLRELQLEQFLEKYLIASAKIKGLGNSRKATLRSYGVETAADISKNRIEAISGFGPATSGLLVSWRASLERRFVFNPNQPVNPAEVARIKTHIAQRRSALEQVLRTKLSELRAAEAQVRHSRTSAMNAASSVWKELKQAEYDKQNLVAGFSLPRRRAVFAGLAAVVFVVSVSLSPRLPATAPNSRPPGPIAQVTQAVPPPVAPLAPPVPWIQLRPPNQPNVSSASQTGTPLAKIIAPSDVVNSSQKVIPIPAPAPTAAVDSELAKLSEEPSTNVRIPDSANTERSDTAFLTSKLKELGYLEANGSWSSNQVKQALKALKLVNGLRADGEFDTATVHLLNFGSPTSAKRSFLGRWATSEACPSGTEMEINPAQAKTDVGSCRLSRVQPDDGGWKIQARCQVGPESWTANITLRLSGTRLDWTSEKGHQTYFRCP